VKTAAESACAVIPNGARIAALANEPALIIPSSDPAVAWLPFSARATSFVGRRKSEPRSMSFSRPQPDSLVAHYGPAGSGKSRLALELAKEVCPLARRFFESGRSVFLVGSFPPSSRP